MAQIESGARYIITNVKGETVIDLSGSDNKSIIGYPRHGEPNQQWETLEADGGWHIQNVQSGTYIGYEGDLSDGIALVSSEQPFVWNITPDDDDPSNFRIFVPDSYQNFDLSDHGNPDPGTPVTLWGKWEGTNQIWRFEKVD